MKFRVGLACLVGAMGVTGILVVGCGGSNGASTTLMSDLDAGSGDAPTGQNNQGDGGGAGADGGGTTSDAASGSDGAAAAPDGSIVADGGTNADAGPGGSATQLPCGTATCAIPGEVCCVASGGQGRTYACVAGTTCPVTGGGGGGGGNTTALQCSSAANCAAGTVCCVTQGQNGQVTSACQTTCGGQNQAQLCDANATTTGCTAGVTCSNNNIGDWGLPPSFATCGGVGN